MNRQTVTYYKDDTREWRWRVTAPNGRIIADSGESYPVLDNAKKGLKSMALRIFFCLTKVSIKP